MGRRKHDNIIYTRNFPRNKSCRGRAKEVSAADLYLFLLLSTFAIRCCIAIYLPMDGKSQYLTSPGQSRRRRRRLQDALNITHTQTNTRVLARSLATLNKYVNASVVCVSARASWRICRKYKITERIRLPCVLQ